MVVALNYHQQYRYAARLGDSADELNDFKNKLVSAQIAINNIYSAEEMTYINNCVNKIIDDISQLDRDLDDLEEDIKEVAYDIYKSDKRKEAAQASY